LYSGQGAHILRAGRMQPGPDRGERDSEADERREDEVACPFAGAARRFTHRRPWWAHLRHAPSSCSLEASCSDQASKAWSTSSQVFSVFSAKAVVPPRLSTASQSKVPFVASVA